jgi:excisionase family DNA binding protein
MATPRSDRPLSSGQVADLFGVNISTVAGWADDGLLPHFKTPGGQRRFRRSDVEAFLRTGVATETSATA